MTPQPIPLRFEVLRAYCADCGAPLTPADAAFGCCGACRDAIRREPVRGLLSGWPREVA